MKSFKIITFAFLFFCNLAFAQSTRECIRLDSGWKFAFGNAASPKKDFGCGTEYFNYLTKANSIHNEGPYAMKFDDSKWRSVRIPHDWAVELPNDAKASHSHGYRTVGFKYPETSIGWYRNVFKVGKEDEGKHIVLQFDGIFRNSRVWVNGFYMGTEPSGYATQVYDITDYIHYGEDNVVAVRADASLEEGWFYEGAGIYRDVWLYKTNNVHVAQFGTFVYANLQQPYDKAEINIETEIENSDVKTNGNCQVVQILKDANGKEVERTDISAPIELLAKEKRVLKQSVSIHNPHLWSTDSPYLYTVETQVMNSGKVVDTYNTTIGIRDIKFDKERGFVLNGKAVKLKGVNMHQDHSGVGAAIPDALQEYRLQQLKKIGCNAYRASHNPMTPAMLDACDRLGFLVIDENRLMGVNDEHLRLLERMIKRDRNHPSIILWSNGNEEWGLENNIQGVRVAASMREYTHRLDPTRLSTLANAGGVQMIQSPDVIGYNYIAQNDIDGHHREHPEWMAVGSEETTGCGTRGVYFPDSTGGSMPSINRMGRKGVFNIIERGWKFYAERPWLGGLFYWTGFDYRGEPNPLKYPAVLSEFGIFDYCGFPKDEAYYLKSWWTDEPVLHILPHWNLQGHEGEKIAVWTYSNMDEIELIVNGKSLGRKTMLVNGYLSWDAVYNKGYLKAIGYKNGKKAKEEIVYTTGDAEKMNLSSNRTMINADNKDVAVLTIRLLDKKNRFVPTACQDVKITLSGEGRIIGVGNGNPSDHNPEHPTDIDCKSFNVKTFNGLAQILIQSTDVRGTINVSCVTNNGMTSKILLQTK